MALALWIGCLGLLAAPESPGPLRWSPDGRWLAFVEPVRPQAQQDEVSPLLFETTERPPAADREEPSAYRLWAFSPQDEQTILLEECAGPISAPSWNRDGSSMAFGRIVRDPRAAAASLELVLQDSPLRKRIIYRHDFSGDVPSAASFAQMEIRWSGDGRTLAVSSFQKPGLLLLKAESGQTIRFLDAATHPCWAREEARLAYFRGPTRSELMVLDRPTAEPRRLLEVPADRDDLPGPFWGRDGQELTFLRRAANPNARPGTPLANSEVLKLWRVRADTGQTVEAIDLIHDSIGRDQPLQGAWYSPDPEGLSVCYATSTPGQIPMQFSWCQNRPNEVHKRLNPLDLATTMGALATRPGGDTLAMRFCLDGRWSPPALCDPVTERVTAVAPDDTSRQRWLAMLTGLMRQGLSAGLAAPMMADGAPAARPSLLPLPGEFEANLPVVNRMRRLSKIGLPLLEAGPGDDRPETHLAMAYLATDYTRAMKMVEALGQREASPARHARLLAVKAQIQMASGDLAGAAPLVEHLRRIESPPSFTVEPDPGGRLRLVPIDNARGSWTDFLAETLVRLQTPAIPDEEEDADEDIDAGGTPRPRNQPPF